MHAVKMLLLAGSLLTMDEVLLYAAPTAMDKSITSTYDGTSQPYILYMPPSAQEKEVPLIVVLHGWGGNQRSWIDYTSVVSKAEQDGFAVAAPHGRGNWFYRQPGEQDVLDVIEDVCKNQRIDRKRIALAGHSMGGWGTAYIGLRNADLFCTIIPMSGWVPEELSPNALNLHPMLIHDRDDPVVLVENSRTAAETFVKLGQDVNYREEIGYGHASRMISDNLDRVFSWILANPKPEHVCRVSIATRTPWTHRGERWLRVLKSQKFPALALAQSELTTDSATLQVQTKNVSEFAVDVRQLHKLQTVVCNGVTFPIEPETTWAILNAENNQWSVRASEQLPKAIAPCAAPTVFSTVETTGSSPALTDVVAEILLPQLNMELLLLPDDMFMNPPGGIKRLDQMLDIAIRPDNRLVKFQVAGAKVKKIQGEKVMPFAELTAFPKSIVVEDEKSYEVVAPVSVLRHLPKDVTFEYLPFDVNEYLCFIRSSEVKK